MRDRWAVLYVHSLLAMAAFASGWYVYSQAPALPLVDEWGLLQEWTQSPSTLEWAWQHHNEHRYPLTKLIWLGILKASDFKFNAPQYATLALMISAATLALWTARGLRGRAHPIDAALPLLFLHYGHGLNWLMGYQLGFALAAYGVVGWLWCAARLSAGGGRGWAYLSAIYAIFILTCGGFGLGFTPPLLIWFGYLAVRSLRRGEPGMAVAMAVFALGVLAYSATVFRTMPVMSTFGYEPVGQPLDFLGVVGANLACGLGTWPAYVTTNPTPLRVFAAAVSVAHAVGIARLLRRLWRERTNAAGSLALGLVILGTLGVAVATARARPSGMLDRYVLFSACGFAALWLGVFADPVRSHGRRGYWLGGALGLLLAGWLFRSNEAPGLYEAYRFRDPTHYLVIDLRAGEPALYLAGRHGGSLNVWRGDSLGEILHALQNAGLRPFLAIPPDPAFTAQPIHELWPPQVWRCPEKDFAEGKAIPMLDLPPPPPGAITLRFVGRTTKWYGRTTLILSWIDAGTGLEQSDIVFPSYFLDSMHHVFQLKGTPTRVRLRAGGPLEGFRIEAFEWLIGESAR